MSEDRVVAEFERLLETERQKVRILRDALDRIRIANVTMGTTNVAMSAIHDADNLKE